MTAYDTLLARRAAALGFALAGLVFLAMLGTDDVASTHAGRLGRLAALASLAGGGGAFLTAAQARSRGEARALLATGVTPFRASLGAAIGGVVVGCLGVALALVPGVDLTPLFPRALPADAVWTREGDGWLDAVRGIRVAADGALHWANSAKGAEGLPRGGAPLAATALALGTAALAFPLWAIAREAPARRAIVCFAVASAAVFVFHLVAAERLGAMTLVFPPLLLLADVAALRRGNPWS